MPSNNERSRLLGDLRLVEEGSSSSPPRLRRRSSYIVPTRKQKREVPYYDCDDNFAVIFQWYGSVWPQVLPWCLLNVAWTYLIIFLRDAKIVNLTISNDTGHK